MRFVGIVIAVTITIVVVIISRNIHVRALAACFNFGLPEEAGGVVWSLPAEFDVGGAAIAAQIHFSAGVVGASMVMLSLSSVTSFASATVWSNVGVMRMVKLALPSPSAVGHAATLPTAM